MSEHRHNVLIGAFIIGSLLIVFVGLIFIGGVGYRGEKQRVVMVFDGSVKGLNIGAPVALRGVTVGQVTDINLLLDPDGVGIIMQVEADLNDENVQMLGGETENVTRKLIDRGLAAQLNTQSLLTGLLYIQLDFYSGDSQKTAPIDSDFLQIPTVPTELELLRRTLETVDFNTVVADVSSITEGLREMINDDAFREMPQRLNTTLSSLNYSAQQITETLQETTPQITDALNEASTAMRTVNDALPELTGLAKQSAQRLDVALASAEQAMMDLSEMVAPESQSMYQLNASLRELTLASRSLQSLVKTLNEQPQVLLRGRGETAE